MSKHFTESNNYSCHQIASFLSLNLFTVRLWINRGWLKADNRSSKHYQVKIGHLKQFLENPPHESIRNSQFAIINCLLSKKL